MDKQTGRRGFLTGGTWCLDRNITLDFWPSEDRVATASDVSLSGGGSACNFAVDMRRLDPSIPVDTTGLIGVDDDSHFLALVAEQNGIGVDGLHRADSGASMVTEAFLSAASGRRTHILYEGMAARLSPEHFDFGDRARRIFHLGLPGVHRTMDSPWRNDPKGWVSVLREANEAGFDTSLEMVTVDAEKLRALVVPCLPWLSFLVVNDYEIGALSGLPTVSEGRTDATAVRRAIERVLDMGAMQFVVVHYVDGAQWQDRDGGHLEMPSVKVPPSSYHGANGAGDAFAAGFLYGYHETWAAEDCLRLGHAAAAASLRAIGTYDALTGWRECLALADDWGWR